MVAQSEDHHHDRQDRREEGEGVERGEQASPWLGPGRHRGGLGQTGARVRCSGAGRLRRLIHVVGGGDLLHRGWNRSGSRRRSRQGDDVGAVLQGELEVVCGHDDRAPLMAQLVDEVHELAGVVPVLPVGGLVQDDDVALLADHGGHRQPPGLAAREGQGMVVPVGDQVELLKELVDPRLRGPSDGELGSDGGGHELVLGVLEDVSDQVPALADVPATDHCLACGGAHETGQGGQDRGLARAVGADQPHELSAAQSHGHAGRAPRYLEVDQLDTGSGLRPGAAGERVAGVDGLNLLPALSGVPHLFLQVAHLDVRTQISEPRHSDSGFGAGQWCLGCGRAHGQAVLGVTQRPGHPYASVGQLTAVPHEDLTRGADGDDASDGIESQDLVDGG